MSQTVPGIPQLLGALQPDAIVAARYRLLAPIDEGGCGQVWRALQQDNRTLVAIKFPRPDLGVDQRERFASELQILKHLPKHPHLVQLLDEGMFEGQPFLVMEYFPKTLSAWLNEHRLARRLPDLFTVYRLFAQICDAVGTTHRLPIPIIHRDINPRKITSVEKGEPNFPMPSQRGREVRWAGCVGEAGIQNGAIQDTVSGLWTKRDSACLKPVRCGAKATRHGEQYVENPDGYVIP